MKKGIAVFLAMLLTASLLAACSVGKEAETIQEPTQTQSTTVFTAPPTGQIIQKTPFTIDGYVLSDGIPAPVTVTLQIDGVLTGQEAFESISYQDPAIAPAPQGQEYILVLLTVTYEDGVLDQISLEKNLASQEDARLCFALSNGDSSAQDLSKHLNNSFYNQTLWEGDSVGAAVAFLQQEGNTHPLLFEGFGQSAAFAMEASAEKAVPEKTVTQEEAEQLKAFALDFMNAYISGDVERMKASLLEIPATDPQVYAGEDFQVHVVPISAWESWAQTLKDKGSCEVSIPFQCDPQDDYGTCLAISIAQQNGTPKVIWYGLKG